MTTQDVLDAVDRYCAQNEISQTIFSEMVGQRFGLGRESAARRIAEARRTGRMSEDYIDRILVVLEMQDEQRESLMQPGIDAFCPKCREVQPSRGDGTCLWCDSQTGGNTIPNVVDKLGDGRKESRKRNAGVPWACSEEQLLEVRRLYLTGLSMYAACAEVHPETGYANPKAMAMAMYSLFEQRGWNRRKQNEATAARNYKHGKARNPAHRRALRRKLGYVRGVKCQGTKRNAPGAGKPCQLAALKDSDYCRFHDPRYQDEHREHCLAMRRKLDEVTA